MRAFGAGGATHLGPSAVPRTRKALVAGKRMNGRIGWSTGQPDRILTTITSASGRAGADPILP